MAIGGILFAGCHSATEPELAGDYALTTINGQALPFDTGPLPPRPGTEESCHAVISAGALHLESRGSTYALEYVLQDDCTDRVLGRSGSSGTFARSADGVHLTAALGAGRTESYEARVDGTRIAFEDRFYAYVFAR